MHDTEPETFVIKSIPEKFSDMLKEIAIDSTQKKLQLMMLKMMIITVECFHKQLEWLQTKAV